MTQQAIVISATVAYLAAVVYVGLLGHNLAKSGDMFNVFGRRAHAIRAASAYLGLIGAGELITFTQLGYENGFDVLWLLTGFAVGFLILLLLSDKVRLLARERKINTLAGYFNDQFGLTASIALSIVSVVSLGSLLAIQFILGSQLISSITGIPADLATIIIGIIIASYLIPSGIVGVLSTDVLRAFMMTIVLVVVVGVTAWAIPGLTPQPIPVEPLSWLNRISFFVLGVFGTFCGADVWQTVLASENSRVVRKSLFTAAIGFIAIGSLIAFIGLITKFQVPTIQGDTPAFLVAIRDVIPGFMAPLVAVLITGSVMATADTEIWVISALLLGNFFPSAAAVTQNENERFQEKVKNATRWVIPAVIVCALVVAHLSRDARSLYEGLLVLLTILGPAHIAIVTSVPSRLGIITSLWSGIVAFFATSLIFGFAIPIEWSLAPLAISVAGYFAGNFIGKGVTKSATSR
jgi:solute:Na+ symporter, SSS family